ncbi:MAG: hypothetical protein EOP85_08790, partial [Verrucomicrobiaceae bacterium]
MQRPSCLIFLISLLAISPSWASPAEAQRIRKTYDLKVDNWTLEMRIAATPEERTKAWNARPDAIPHAREMWAAIGNDLDQDWTLESAAWFLRITPGLLARDGKNLNPQPIFSRENETIRKAIETYHLKSAKLTP